MEKDTTCIGSTKDTACIGCLKVLFRFRLICLLLFIVLTGLVFSGCPAYPLKQHPDPYKPLSFPRDHGSHPKTSLFEWWYYNGDLTTESGNTYYIFVCFFRGDPRGWNVIGLPADAATWIWPIKEFIPYHFTGYSIVDVKRNKYKKEYNSIFPFFWKDYVSEQDFDYKMGKDRGWRQPDGSYRIQAKIKGYKLDLTLTPADRPPLISGPEGLGNLSPENTLHKYYSVTRMKTEGTIKKGRQIEKVTGHCWMDHQWSIMEEPKHKLQGWDWMGINLDNGIDFHIANVNLNPRGIHPESFITLQYPDGRRYHHELEDFTLRPTRKWRSWKSGITYGIDWTIDVPKHDLHLTVKAKRDKQEITIIPIRFWEGHCDVEGTYKGKPIHGRAFLETFGNNKLRLRKLVTVNMEPLDYCKNSPEPKNPPLPE